MEAADRHDQIKQRYLDYDQAACTQALVAPAGAYLIIEGYVVHEPPGLTWCVFVPPGQVQGLIKQGLVLLDQALAAA